MMIENHRTQLIWRLMRDVSLHRRRTAARRIHAAAGCSRPLEHGMPTMQQRSDTAATLAERRRTSASAPDNVRPPIGAIRQPARPLSTSSIVGAGPAGLVAAHAAAALGAKVALVERDLLGGDCLNFGCVPSKSIIRTVAPVCGDAPCRPVRRAGPGDIHVDFAARDGAHARGSAPASAAPIPRTG